MRQFRALTAALLIVCPAPHVAGQVRQPQSPRLQFLSRLKDDTTVSGAVTIKVSTDPILRPRGMKVGVEVDGQLQGTADSLPWTLVWDSTNAPDGPHVVRLVLINGKTNETGIVDEMRIRTSNRVARPAADSPQLQPERDTPSRPRQQVPADEKPANASPNRTAAGSDRQRATPERGGITGTSQQGDRTATAIDQAAPTSNGDYPAEASRAGKALDLPATSLSVASGKLLIGRSDGSISVFDPASRDGWSVRAPVPAGPVIAAARSGNTVGWITGSPGDSITSSSAGSRLFVYNEMEKKVRVFDLAGGASGANRIALWAGRALLAGPGGAAILDLGRGLFEEINAQAGLENLPNRAGADLLVAAEDKRAVLIAFGVRSGGGPRGPSVRTGELAAWENRDGRWSRIELPSLIDSGVANVRAVAASSSSIGLFSQTGVAGLTLETPSGEVRKLDYPQSDQTWKPAARVAISGTHVWSLRGTTLYHADLESGRQDAFLPWNSTNLSPGVMAADGESLWFSTSGGIKRINLAQPDPESGYAGFVRARLGSEQDKPGSQAALRLADEIDAWQGTPYLWGGESKSGVDCSGFVMRAFEALGVRLSHGSAWLRTCRVGSVVKDELAYGDVLVIPGHCMIYTGDGTTAETVNKAVGRASIWRRNGPVVIRRFLSARSIETEVFASRKGGYKTPKKSPASKRRG